MPDDRPIVEQPPDCEMCDIEEPSGVQCLQCIGPYLEHLAAERDRWKRHCADAMVEVHNLEARVAELDALLEVCEGRRWEAEEKVGELMEEVDRLNAVINNVRT